MPIAHVEFTPEELANTDELWLRYSLFEQMRDLELCILQGPDDGSRRLRLQWFDTLTILGDSLAAGIIVSTLMKCYEQDTSLYMQTAAPSFDAWLHTLITKYRDIFNCGLYPKLRDLYWCFGAVRMRELLPLVNKWLQAHSYNVRFGDTYLEVSSPAQG